jgi:hypothetical protein
VTPQPLPAERFVVLAKRPGHIPVKATKLLGEDAARAHLDSLFSRPEVRGVQYALAELQLVENYR